MKKIIFILTFILSSALIFGQGKVTITTNINSEYADSSGIAKNALKIQGLDTTLLKLHTLNSIPIASPSILGTVKIGSGLSINGSGVVSASGSSKWSLSGDTDIYNNNTGSVGIGTNGPANTSAILDLVSSTKGLLIPRVSLTANIISPIAGLIVYQTGDLPGYYVYDGSTWDLVTYGLTTDPTTPLALVNGTVANLSMAQADAGNNGWLSSADWNVFANKLSSQWTTSSNNVYFSSGSTGNVGIGTGTTIPNRLTVTHSSTSTYPVLFQNTANSASGNVLILKGGVNTKATGPIFISFQTPDGTTIGSITENTTGVVLNITSDSTLKTNIKLTHFGLKDLMKLKTVDFNWKADKSKQLVTGFLAQDVYKIYPDAVTKPQNATDKWQMSREALVPLLVKSVQDQQAEISDLTKRIEKLEKFIK